MQLGQTKKHTGSKLSSNVYKSEAFFCWPSMPMGIEVRDCFFKIGCIILRNFNESINQGYPNGFIHLSLPKIREKDLQLLVITSKKHKKITWCFEYNIYV